MKRFALIGKPLSHSFSASYFTEKFVSQSIDSDYRLIEVDGIDGVRHLVSSENLSGFNVTIPYKQSILNYLDEISPEASTVGAVNCVKVVRQKLTGFNTDVFGFEHSLKSFITSETKKALILGNGGSSQAVQYVLHKMKISFEVVSRTGRLNYENLHPAQIKTAQLIINTTPLGMSPSMDELPDIPYEAMSSSHSVFDLIYNPEETAFLKRCRLLGAKTKNGMEMLKLQAEESWRIWNA